MYHRNMREEILSLAKGFPVITILGPRQSGKTTLAQMTFPSMPYVNLEAPDVQEFAHTDPRGFLGKYPHGAILGEVQKVPELLSYIQVIVDENQKKGFFILTKSHQPGVHQAITQSLAGRTALVTLLPMSLEELATAEFTLPLDEALLKGGFPRLFKDQLDPTKTYRNYLQTYIERDVRQISNIKDLIQFQKFIRLCAGRIGQILNLEGLGGEVGVSSPTAKEWISILEASFIIVRLAPYYENFGKRIIKSPKIYFTDVGLACYLLGIETEEQLSRDPLRGNLVENLVVLELMKARLNKGLDPQLYYFRDTHGHEVDLIFQRGNELVPIEIKASQTFNSDFLKNIKYFQKIVGERAPTGFLVYAGTHEQSIDSSRTLHYSHASQALI